VKETSDGNLSPGLRAVIVVVLGGGRRMEKVVAVGVMGLILFWGEV
jgi:hypothetical protein